MKVDVDTKQRLMTALIFLTEFYKVLMGTFLGVFVPLKCKDQLCSVTDNIFTDDHYHMVTNIYNLISFVFVLSFYFVELRRENWSIEFLDIDETKALTNLDDEVEDYPVIKKNMKSLNTCYYRMIHIAIFMLVSNFTLSGVLVGFNYYNINTLNSILSFFMLVFMKLNKARGIASMSLKNEQVCSGFLTTPKVYNTIDLDYKHKHEPIENLESGEKSMNP